MLEIEITKKKNLDVIDSKLLHAELKVKSYHADWIRRRIDNYQFEKDKDYFLDQLSTLRGGTKRKVYLLTLDMAKELAMIENNESGKRVRRYFIELEKRYFEEQKIISVSTHIRKSLTDAVEESGEQDRMHNHGFSTYTLMVYSYLGIKNRYFEWKKETGGKGEFRKTLESDLRKKLATAEGLVKNLLELDKQYSEIRDTLKPLFEKKEIE